MHSIFAWIAAAFFHRSGYQEDDEQQRLDFEALFAWREMHQQIQSQLFLELKTKLPYIRTVCEVGHGGGHVPAGSARLWHRGLRL